MIVLEPDGPRSYDDLHHRANHVAGHSRVADLASSDSTRGCSSRIEFPMCQPVVRK